MRVVFMGTPAFAVPVLRSLAGAHEVLEVYTRPDKVRGRGRTPAPCPVAVEAHRLGIEVRQPETVRSAEETRHLAELAPDVICVAAYGCIIPADILALPSFGCLNVHASLLPRHRGAAPIHRAILEGDEQTGVCVMMMEEGLDTGPYTECAAVPVGRKSVAELESELSDLGAAALVRVLDHLAGGSVTWTPQDEGSATYAPKVTSADVALAPDLSVAEADRRIRASTPSARAKVVVGDCTLDVLEAVQTAVPVAPGGVHAERDCLVLGFSDGALEIPFVRPQGRNDMPGCAWARGARLCESDVWEPA